MAYPQRATFGRDGFWIQAVADDGATWLCSAAADALIEELQVTLRDAGIAPAPSYDGVRVSSADVVADMKWGPMTQRVLWLAALHAGLPAAWIESIAADGRAHRLHSISVYAAIYIIMSMSASSGLFIESGTGPEVLRAHAGGFDVPAWNTIPLTSATPNRLGCVLQVPAVVPGVPTVTEPTLVATASPAVPAPPPPGVAPLPIPVAPAVVSLAVGAVPTTVVEEGLSWEPIAIGAALIVATVFVVRSLRSQPEPARAPVRRRKAA